jgi:hypothetical protein
MALTRIIIVITVWLGFSTINNCLSMGKNPKNLFSSHYNHSGTA